MAHIFVDNSTVGIGTGTYNDGYNSIQDAIDNASAGDTIVIRFGNGVYRLRGEVSYKINKPGLTIIGEVWSGELDNTGNTNPMPILTPARTTDDTDWTADAAFGGVHYLEVPSNVNPHFLFDLNASGLNIRALELEGGVAALAATVSGGTWYFDQSVSPARLYYLITPAPLTPINPRDPILRPQQVLVPEDIAFFEGVDNLAAGTTIKNLRFENWGRNCIKTGLNERWKIIKCSFVDGFGSCAMIEGDQGHVERNRLSEIGEHRFPVPGVTLPVDGVTPVSDNEGGITLRRTSDSEVRANYVEHFSGAGVVIDGAFGDGTDGNNLVVGNLFTHQLVTVQGDPFGGVFVAFRGFHNAPVTKWDFVLRNTSILHGRNGLNICASMKVVFAENTIYDCKAGIGFAQKNEDCIVVNNLVFDTMRSWNGAQFANAPGIDPNDFSEVVTPTSASEEVLEGILSFRMDGNVYGRSTGTPRFQVRDRVYSFEAWKELMAGFDLTSKVVSSAGFYNADEEDFTLAPGSEAIGTFVDISSEMAQSRFAGRSRKLVGSRGHAGSQPPYPSPFYPPEDLIVSLTGNEIAENSQYPNQNPSMSVGGDASDQDSYVIDLSVLFDHLSGVELDRGITEYRAVDLMSGAARAAANSSDGSELTNFTPSTLHRWEVVTAYISRQPNHENVTIEFGWEINASAKQPDDITDPGTVTFSTASDAGSALAIPTTHLEGKVFGAVPTFARLWVRRIVSQDSLWERADYGTITLLGSTRSQGVIV